MTLLVNTITHICACLQLYIGWGEQWTLIITAGLNLLVEKDLMADHLKDNISRGKTLG